MNIKEHISSKLQEHKNAKFLLAVSGGLDSMFLAKMFLLLKLDFCLAHCNFNLRGDESDGDEVFVKEWAKKHKVKLFTEDFQLEKVRAESGMGVQEAAREVRYKFFYEILEKESLDFIVVAHHADDQIETVLFNFLRGTSIRGLSGMRFESAKILRPMLEISREEIFQESKELGLQFREDSSNVDLKYSRNYLRNKLMPELEKEFPNIKERLQQSIPRFAFAEGRFEQQMELLRKKYLLRNAGDVLVPIRLLEQEQDLIFVLYELFKEFGLKATQKMDVVQLFKAQSGKYLETKSHHIIKDRKHLIIAKKNSVSSDNILIHEGDLKVEVSNGTYFISKENYSKENLNQGPNVACVDLKEIEFPLRLRSLKEGDYFYPLGMNKKKKLSRFLIDSKVSLNKKKEERVLLSGSKVVWLVGHRIDHRFRILPRSQKILKIKFRPHAL